MTIGQREDVRNPTNEMWSPAYDLPHLVIQQPHTIHHPDAIVVHLEDAPPADGAVVCTLRLPGLAALAEPRPPGVSPVCMCKHELSSQQQAERWQ